MAPDPFNPRAPADRSGPRTPALTNRDRAMGITIVGVLLLLFVANEALATGWNTGLLIAIPVILLVVAIGGWASTRTTQLASGDARRSEVTDALEAIDELRASDLRPSQRALAYARATRPTTPLRMIVAVATLLASVARSRRRSGR